MMSFKIKSKKDVSLVRRPLRGSRYEALFEQMRKLKPTEALELPVPQELPLEVAMVRLTAAMHRVGLKPDKPGHRFKKRRTEDGKIAIFVVPDTRAK